MKTFIDPEERLIMKIPDDWYFTAEQNNGDVTKQPFGFEPYEERNGALQISYRENLPKKKFKIDPQPKGQTNLSFIETKHEGIKTWVTNIEGGGVIVISYVYDKSIGEEQIKSDLNSAAESVKSLLIFDNASKEKILPYERWNRFMLSYAASIDLINRAYTNGSNIELVILLANQLDAVLRQSLILKKQLDEKTDTIDVGLIHQKETDRPIFEKKVYGMALDQAVIDQDMHDNLVKLYDIRNKVVHRYVISDLRSEDIIQLVWSYSQIFDKLGDDLIKLEQKQFEEQIGIHQGDTRPGEEMTDEMTKSIITRIRDKHGNRKLNEGISINIKNEKGG
jgi:hypothetical protein